jgi:large subunit ribosomal protein L27
VGSQVFARTVEANDLKLIRGIGPKLEEILHRAGIQSWAQLALYKLPDLRTILEEAGPRYRIFDPKTWSVQARMAARGEWRKLKAYQDTLTELGE